jgi:hypothetical protein|tara:strand:- start:282 stop:476 length:195 start_codon:yes stop_codon:yes gene_type:complete
MKWMLVYIMIAGNEPIAVNAMGPFVYFDTMTECFFQREKLSETIGGRDGHFPPGRQAICVRMEK